MASLGKIYPRYVIDTVIGPYYGFSEVISCWLLKMQS